MSAALGGMLSSKPCPSYTCSPISLRHIVSTETLVALKVVKNMTVHCAQEVPTVLCLWTAVVRSIAVHFSHLGRDLSFNWRCAQVLGQESAEISRGDVELHNDKHSRKLQAVGFSQEVISTSVDSLSWSNHDIIPFVLNYLSWTI